MKKFFLSAAVALMALAANAQANLEFGGVSTEGGVTKATINLSTCESDASGFQCDILAPEGVSILDTDDDYPEAQGMLAASNKKQGDFWTFQYSKQESASHYRFVAYGTKIASFATNWTNTEDKSMFTIPFDKAEGTVKVSKIEVANGKGEKIQTVTEFTFELGGTSGISSVSTNQLRGVAYNVAGQKVAADAKGLVIMNGKKFMNK